MRRAEPSPVGALSVAWLVAAGGQPSQGWGWGGGWPCSYSEVMRESSAGRGLGLLLSQAELVKVSGMRGPWPLTSHLL